MTENVRLSTCQWVVCLTLMCAPAAADAQSAGQGLFQKHQCGSCHAIDIQPADAFDPAIRSSRKGPVLADAGIKLRKEWVAQWLQDPIRIRPAGAFPPVVTTTGPGDKDQIDESGLAPHPSLSTEDAAAISEYLATLKAQGDRLAAIEVKPTNLPKKMAALNFGKFKGCIACHRDAPDNGGVSGPELYTAWARNTPEFLFVYIRDPSAWDKHTMMPGLALNDVEINKLLGYLKTISGVSK